MRREYLKTEQIVPSSLMNVFSDSSLYLSYYDGDRSHLFREAGLWTGEKSNSHAPATTPPAGKVS
jgi:hypothetical protein